MSTTSTILPQHQPSPDCPGPITLERAIVGGSCDDDLRCHLESCLHCQEQAQLIRDNLTFMRGISPDLVFNQPSSGDAGGREGELLSGYTIIREIARGGQGVVFEAVQLQTKRRAAIKLIEPDADGGFRGNRRRRIEREAELVASLRHPNIVTIYHCSPLPGGRFALAMEYVDGVSMDTWAKALDAATPPTRDAQREALRTKLRAFCSVCDAVQHAHHNGVIHRDLKPGNVLVSVDNVPRVVDFGVALRASQSPRLTRAGGFAGTLAYASPEQVSGDPDAVDTRSDVYALGVILYEILAGRPPYDTAGSLTGAINNITHSRPSPLRQIQPGDQTAGAELEAIVAKALSKERVDRYQSAAALKDDIENWLSGAAVVARPHTALYVLRKLAARNRLGVAVAGLVLALLIALAVSMAWSSHRLKLQRSLLANSLSSSLVERGRLLGMSGGNARAEELIWPEFVSSGARADDPALLFDTPPAQMQAAWALVELYAKRPSILHMRTLQGAETSRFEPDNNDIIRVINADGAEQRISISRQKILDSSPGDLTIGSSRPITNTTRTHATLRAPGGAIVIDLNSGERRTFSDPLLESAFFADVNADASLALSIDVSGTLRLWNLNPFAHKRLLASGLTPQTQAKFSPDGTLISAGVQDRIQTWRTSDGFEDRSWLVPLDLGSQLTRQQISPSLFTPDGSGMAAGVQNHVLLFSASDPTLPPRRFPSHLGYVNWLDFSNDGRLLFSSASDRVFKVFDVASGELVNSFEHGAPVYGRSSISTDGSKIAILDNLSALRIFETHPQQWFSRLRSSAGSIHAVRYTPDGSALLSISSEGILNIWRTADHALLASLQVTSSPLLALALSRAGDVAYVGSQQGEIFRVRLPTPSELRDPSHRITFVAEPFARASEYLTCLTCSADPGFLVAAGSRSAIEFLDARTGESIQSISGHQGRVVQCVASSDGSFLITVGADGVAIVWDAPTHTERFRTPTVGVMARAVCIAPDDRSFFVGSDDWKIRRYDLATGRLLSTISGVKQHVFGLAIHPAGNVLFSSGRDSGVQVWDTRTGRELAILESHSEMILGLALSPDGKHLATGSADQSVGLWDLEHYRTHLLGNQDRWRSSPPPSN